jgi:hypothetical protein
MDETKLFKKFSTLVLLATFFQCLKLQADDIGISELSDPEDCHHSTSSKNKVHDLLLFSRRKPCWFLTFVD